MADSSNLLVLLIGREFQIIQSFRTTDAPDLEQSIGQTTGYLPQLIFCKIVIAVVLLRNVLKREYNPKDKLKSANLISSSIPTLNANFYLNNEIQPIKPLLVNR